LAAVMISQRKAKKPVRQRPRTSKVRCEAPLCESHSHPNLA
jgi:hypothetical protein